MLVAKFGGTSVGSAERMQQVVTLSKQMHRELSGVTLAPVIVLSAMSGVTNDLIAGANKALHRDLAGALITVDLIREKHSQAIEILLGQPGLGQSVRAGEQYEALDKQLEELKILYKGIGYLGELSKRSLDAISGMGELMSSRIVAAYSKEVGIPAEWVDARSFMITDDQFGKASPIWSETTAKIKQVILPLVSKGTTVFTQGYIGSTAGGVNTTLGRGGSDYSASIIGVALDVEEIQIWTDVSGMLTADPRVTPEARVIESISFQEASELAYFGARVLHPLTIKPAVEKKIPVRILNTLKPADNGTLITDSVESAEVVRAVASKKGITGIFISSPKMLMSHGFLAKVFTVFERYQVPIDIISTSEISISLTIDQKERLPEVVRDLSEYGEVHVLEDLAIVSVVGRQYRQKSGIAGRIFSSLKDVNIIMISGGASDINVAFVVGEDDADRAVCQLHAEFFASVTCS